MTKFKVFSLYILQKKLKAGNRCLIGLTKANLSLESYKCVNGNKEFFLQRLRNCLK